MDPNQTPYPGQPNPTPPPQQPSYAPAAPQPYPGANQQSIPQQPSQTYPASPAQQPRQAPAPAAWYTPAPKPEANKPSDASSYLQAAGVGTPPPQSAQATAVPGQMINGQYAVDYLDQVAGGSSGSKEIDKKFIFIGAGVAVALLLAGALLFMRPKTVNDNKPVKLYTTLIDTEKTTVRSGKLLKSSKLVSINGSIRTNIINAARDMEAPLTAAGQKPASLKSAANKAPYHDEKFASALEDARLNATYDRVYANEINTKLKYIVLYMESIKKTTKSKKMNEFIDKNLPSMQTVQKAMDEYQKSEASAN